MHIHCDGIPGLEMEVPGSITSLLMTASGKNESK